MNFYDLMKHLCYAVGVQNDTPMSFNDSDEETYHYKQYLNDALADIWSEDWNFRKANMTFNTIVGVANYTRPQGIICQNGVSIDGNILKCVDITTLPPLS